MRHVASASAGSLARDVARCAKQEDLSKRQACKYEAKTRAKFEKRKRTSCIGALEGRLRKVRSAKARKKVLSAPCLVPLARFDPFTVKRGEVELKLKVPPAYRPSHIGMTVQEVRKMTPQERERARKRMEDRDKPLFPYVAFGSKDGGIVPIDDAKFLHRVKPRRRG